jgi:hypothetical protein
LPLQPHRLDPSAYYTLDLLLLYFKTASLQPHRLDAAAYCNLYSYSTSKRSLPASFTRTLLYSTNKNVHFEPHWLKPTARTRANRRLLLCYEASKAYHCYAMMKPLKGLPPADCADISSSSNPWGCLHGLGYRQFFAYRQFHTHIHIYAMLGLEKSRQSSAIDSSSQHCIQANIDQPTAFKPILMSQLHSSDY